MDNPTGGRRKAYIGVIAILFIVVLVVAIAVPVSLRNSGGSSDEDKVSVPETSATFVRRDCDPQVDVPKSACASRGCVFDPQEKPSCAQLVMNTSFTFNQTTLNGEGLGGVLTHKGGGATEHQWLLSVQYINDHLLRFSVNNYKQDRYQVPVPLHIEKAKLANPDYEFRIISNDPFDFEIIRKETGTVIWALETEFNPLVLTNQLLQITTRLPSTNMYGLGEHMHERFRHHMNITWPSFARDQPPSYDPEANLYGVHPFYTCVEDSGGRTHGVLLFNSNAQEYAFSPRPSLTYRTIGGILDFYIFMGPSPEQVIQQYTQVIGRPVMPPYWALGFQLSRYGYNNLRNLQDAVESTKNYSIPQDVQYVDIDHMAEQKDFTIDELRFPGLNAYFKSLQAEGMRIIYLLDPCLMASKMYEPYKVMTEADGAIKWPQDVSVPDNVTDSTGALLGFVWPKEPVIFPDFFKPSARMAWKKLVKSHRDKLTFDGLWIDMNEPASFGTNLDKPWNWPETRKPYWTLRCPDNAFEDPPYRPKAAYRWDTSSTPGRLSDKTICLSAVQGDKGQYRHYDVHNLYGWSQTRPTLEVAQDATKERSVVIARSTFPGSGRYTGHWLGDNASIWPDLHRSIIGMLEFNLFGIPYVGADICGFNGDTSKPLCKRWMQLGAFYPFCRNHNAINSKNQGPGQMGDDLANASAEILNIRYTLLPYLYTLFHQAHTIGSTVVRPLHHEYPSDAVALSIDTQFLWGSCFMVAPILEENQASLNIYLPSGNWYNYITHEERQSPTGQWHGVAVDGNSKPELFVKGGCILPEQEPANNTHFSRQNPFSLLVALDEQGMAHGKLFWDDGKSIDTFEKKEYFTADISAEDSKLKISVTHKVSGKQEWQTLDLGQVVILGVKKNITQVSSSMQSHQISFTQKNEVLTITPDKASMATGGTTLSWSSS